MEQTSASSEEKVVRVGRKILVELPSVEVPGTKALINITNEMMKASAREYLFKAAQCFCMGMYILVTGEMESIGFSQLQGCANNLNLAEKMNFHYFE